MSPVQIPTAAQQFDGLVSQRAESIRFDVYTASGDFQGRLAVDKSRNPTITNDTSRPVRRTVDGLYIPPRPLADSAPLIEGEIPRLYADDIDPLTMFVKAWWVLGLGGFETQCGEYVWSDDSEAIASWGTTRPAMLADRCCDLAQPLDTNVGYDIGANLSAILTEQATAAGITSISIESTSATLSVPLAWIAGRDTRLGLMEAVCALAGFLPPYFDNSGVFVCRATPDLATATPDFVYGPGTTMVMDSIVRSSNRLKQANRFVVVDSAAADMPLVGVYDVPDSLPYSYAATTRRTVFTSTVQGLTDQASANAAAAQSYVTNGALHLSLAFDTTPDPRHDTWDMCYFESVNYIQKATRLPCLAGASMSHDAAA